MALRFLTEDLVESVKRRSLIPVSQSTFEDDDIVALANEEIGITIVPDIQSIREDMFLTLKEYTLVSGQTDYRLPERAIGSALKSVVLSPNSDTTEYELPRIPVNRREVTNTSGSPDSFFLKGDYVSLMPTPSSSGTLRLWYFCRPASLVFSTEAAVITAIVNNGATYTLTVDTDLTGTLSLLTLADVINTKSPAVVKAMDLTISAISAGSVTVTADSSIAVGDTLVLAQTANTPLVPQEFQPVLAQAIACRLLQALGDLNKLQIAMASLSEMRSQALKLIANRVETAVEHFNNPRSIGNSMGRYSRRAALR